MKTNPSLYAYLSMALPYNLRVKTPLGYGTLVGLEFSIFNLDYAVELEDYHKVYFDSNEIKACLRPMPSITEEEAEEFEKSFIGYSISRDRNCVYHSNRGDLNMEIIKWFLKNHFDFMGLIPNGLAEEEK